MHLLIDPVGGLSGDMLLGALVDLGLGVEGLREILRRIPVKIEFSLERREFGVSLDFEGERLRGIDELLSVVSRSRLVSKDKALEALGILVDAEKKVHGEEADLHELLDVDTLADVCGFFEGLEMLGFKRFYITPIPLSFGGVIESQHGPLPNPAPATSEIIKDLPVTFRVGDESVTPTGAAMVKALSPSLTLPETFSIKRWGSGVGKKSFPDRPNMVRLFHISPLETLEDEVFLFETNIDDMRPELVPPLFERLFEKGALDVVLLNALMKKGRPGYVLKVLVPMGREDEVLRTILEETTTLGVRVSRERRVKLPRKTVKRNLFGRELDAKESAKGVKVECSELDKLSKELGLPLWIMEEKGD